MEFSVTGTDVNIGTTLVRKTSLEVPSWSWAIFHGTIGFSWHTKLIQTPEPYFRDMTQAAEGNYYRMEAGELGITG